jgi:hypothetical protein
VSVNRFVDHKLSSDTSLSNPRYEKEETHIDTFHTTLFENEKTVLCEKWDIEISHVKYKAVFHAGENIISRRNVSSPL